MDRYRLKNIIIIILLLVNSFLTGSLVVRQTSERTSLHQTAEQLVELLAADGITLEADSIPAGAPPACLSLPRDIEQEQNVAAFFLGRNPIRSDRGGEIYAYTGNTGGAAQFRAGGSFDIACTQSSTDGADLVRDFCRRFSYEEPVFMLDDSGSGTATAVCLRGKLPVFNCTVTFTLDQGTLIAVSGTLLPKNSSAASYEQEPLSAAAALTAFQTMRREQQAAVSSITEISSCYELQSTASALTLVPVWCITTDTESYYVNCITGVVTAG